MQSNIQKEYKNNDYIFKLYKSFSPNRFYNLFDDKKVTNLNFLQFLVLYSNNSIVKSYLKNNIQKFKNEINHKNNIGATALLIAFKKQNYEIFKLLLRNGADPNVKNYRSYSILMSICMDKDEFKENHKYVSFLLKYNIDINYQNKFGLTALMYTFYRNCNIQCDIKIIKILLENGANPNIKDKEGRTALFFAFDNIDIFDDKKILLLLKYCNLDDKSIKNIKIYDFNHLKEFNFLKNLII